MNVDDEILETAKSIAGERNLSLGAVLSESVLCGLQQAMTIRHERKGFPVFEVSDDSTPLTLDRAKRYENES